MQFPLRKKEGNFQWKLETKRKEKKKEEEANQNPPITYYIYITGMLMLKLSLQSATFTVIKCG